MIMLIFGSHPINAKIKETIGMATYPNFTVVKENIAVRKRMMAIAIHVQYVLEMPKSKNQAILNILLLPISPNLEWKAE